MGDWDDPIQRAAVWYVAAFGALTAVLIAGASLTNFDVTEARHPVLSCLLAVAAVGAAGWVGFAASHVLAPRWTGTSLKKRQETTRLSIGSAAAPTGIVAGSWQHIASGDPKVLSPLYVEDGFTGQNDSPRALWAAAQTGDAAAAERLRSLITAACRRSSRRWFRLLTATAPASLAIILAAALLWGSVSTPDPHVASADHPIPVTVRLASGIEPESLYGPGCTTRDRSGVAIDGVLPQRATVAMPATDSCPAVIVDITPQTGTIERN